MKNLIVIVILAAVITGCHESRFDERWQRREDNINDLWTSHATREMGRPMNIEELGNTAEEMQRVYDQRLQATLENIEARSRMRYQKWIEEESGRRKHFEDNATGNPESIEKTWTKLTP
ncbi:MAG: hypothetical protein ACYTHJ_00360 [Planctomycetota bacterium]|jgi:hypothetical protein